MFSIEQFNVLWISTLKNEILWHSSKFNGLNNIYIWFDLMQLQMSIFVVGANKKLVINT